MKEELSRLASFMCYTLSEKPVMEEKRGYNDE